jgi:DAACS family dicarboxylate/amino acid:cation (Na+ or H+) symporter
MLGIIFFGLVFGAALTMIRDDRRQAMTAWLEALADVVTTIIDFAMRIAPYGVAGLIFGVTSRFGFALLASARPLRRPGPRPPSCCTPPSPWASSSAC